MYLNLLWSWVWTSASHDPLTTESVSSTVTLQQYIILSAHKCNLSVNFPSYSAEVCISPSLSLCVSPSFPGDPLNTALFSSPARRGSRGSSVEQFTRDFPRQGKGRMYSTFVFIVLILWGISAGLKVFKGLPSALRPRRDVCNPCCWFVVVQHAVLQYVCVLNAFMCYCLVCWCQFCLVWASCGVSGASQAAQPLHRSHTHTLN